MEVLGCAVVICGSTIITTHKKRSLVAEAEVVLADSHKIEVNFRVIPPRSTS